jgi:ABC-type uncharacterized transport system permease subunit
MNYPLSIFPEGSGLLTFIIPCLCQLSPIPAFLGKSEESYAPFWGSQPFWSAIIFFGNMFKFWQTGWIAIKAPVLMSTGGSS